MNLFIRCYYRLLWYLWIFGCIIISWILIWWWRWFVITMNCWYSTNIINRSNISTLSWLLICTGWLLICTECRLIIRSMHHDSLPSWCTNTTTQKCTANNEWNDDNHTDKSRSKSCCIAISEFAATGWITCKKRE